MQIKKSFLKTFEAHSKQLCMQYSFIAYSIKFLVAALPCCLKVQTAVTYKVFSNML